MGTQVFGVIPAESMEAVKGGSRVRVLSYDDVAAIVDDDPQEEPAALLASLRSHAEALGDALGRGPVLPVKFGTTLPDDETVISEFLRPNHSRWRELLEQMRDKVEMSVRVQYRQDAILTRVLLDDPQLLAEHDRIQQTGPDAAARIDYGRNIMEAVMDRSSSLAPELYAELEEASLQIRSRPTPDAYVVMQVSCLVAREDVPRFEQVVERMAHRTADVDISLVGPLAPYSFVEDNELGLE